MAYVWIFAGCYALALVIINAKISTQTSRTKAALKEVGFLSETFDADRRAALPLSRELLIRVWAPFVYCLVPAVVVCIGYFIFS